MLERTALLQPKAISCILCRMASLLIVGGEVEHLFQTGRTVEYGTDLVRLDRAVALERCLQDGVSFFDHVESVIIALQLDKARFLVNLLIDSVPRW